MFSWVVIVSYWVSLFELYLCVQPNNENERSEITEKIRILLVVVAVVVCIGIFLFPSHESFFVLSLRANAPNRFTHPHNLSHIHTIPAKNAPSRWQCQDKAVKKKLKKIKYCLQFIQFMKTLIMFSLTRCDYFVVAPVSLNQAIFKYISPYFFLAFISLSLEWFSSIWLLLNYFTFCFSTQMTIKKKVFDLCCGFDSSRNYTPQTPNKTKSNTELRVFIFFFSHHGALVYIFFHSGYSHNNFYTIHLYRER